MSEPSEAEIEACGQRLYSECGVSWMERKFSARWHLKETSALRAEVERLRHALQDAALALDYSWGDFRIKQAEALIRVKEALHPLKDQQNEKHALI